MGKEEIKTKLQDVLIKEELDEVDIVYILRSIRKILDINRNKEYKKLRFYCNWALHIQINNTDMVSEELRNFPDDVVSSNKFLNYKIFHEELKKFLKKYSFKTNLYKNYDNVFKFNKLLTDIYIDTPLVVRSVKKKIITLKSADYTKKISGGILVKIPATRFTVTYEK